MKNNTILISIVLAIVVGAGGFFAGMQYQKSQKTNVAGQLGNRAGGARTGAGGAGRNGMGATVGQIISQDNNSITVKLQDGSSKIVLISGSTAINKAASGSQSDLQTGTMVAVFGTANSDGSVTASNVQINPMMRFGGPRGSAMPQQ